MKPWAIKMWPWLHRLNKQQVSAIGGTFHNSGCGDTPTIFTWFVPTAAHLPVMVKRPDGLWWPRGF